MASDNFTRANSNPIAAPWGTATGFGAMQLLSNTCRNATTGVDAACRYTSSSVLNSIVVLSTLSDGDCGPAIFDASGNGYSFNGAGGNLSVIKFTGGAFVGFIGTTAGSYTAGVPLGIRRVGNNLVCSINSVDVLTSSADTTYLTGNPSIHDFSGTDFFSSWTDGVSGDIFFGQACL